MDRTEILERLDRLGIQYEIAEHEAAGAIEEIDGFGLPNSGCIAKNLFLCDDKSATIACSSSRRTRLWTSRSCARPRECVR